MSAAQLTAAPHRSWFFLGLCSALLSMAWWLLFWLGALYAPSLAIAPPAVPAQVHGILMSHGLLGFYIFGFLSTVFPRWQSQPPIPRRAWLPGVVAAGAGYAASLAGLLLGRWLLTAGLAALALGHGLASLPLLRVYLAAGEQRVIHARVALLGLGAGLGALLTFTWGVASGAPELGAAAVQAAIWLYLLPIFSAVAHRMIPFFSSRVVEGYQRVRPPAPLVLILLGAAGHFALDRAGLSPWRWIPDLLAAAAAGWLAIAWQPWRCLRPALLGTLHLGFAWLPLALLLSATQSLILLLTGRLLLPQGPLHALTIGVFGTLLLAMVTRVSLGHSGRPLHMSGLSFALVLGVQLIALLRIGGELPGALSWPLKLGAAGLWLLVFGIWAGIYGPFYWRPRADGRPG